MTDARRSSISTGLLAALLCILLSATAASAGTGTADTPSETTSEQVRYGQILFQEDPGGTLVATSFRFPVGSAQDPDGQEGTAFLLGRALEDEAGQRLATPAARVQVDVSHDEFLVTLLAPPEGWAASVRVVESLLRGSGLSESRIGSLRDDHRARLLFEEGAPVRQFDLERGRLLLGIGHPGARPVEGSRSSTEAISGSDPVGFLERHLDLSAAVVAVVGPVARSEVESALGGPLTMVDGVLPFQEAPALSPPPTAPSPADEPAEIQRQDTVPRGPELPPPPRTRLREAPFQPLTIPEAGAGATAWASPDRSMVDEQLTSTWMAVAWPLPQGTPWTLLEFLAHALEGAVVPSPPGPGQFSTRVQVDWVEGLPVLVFHATVDPRVALRWEERILDGMPGMSQTPLTGSFFELGRRQFRSRVLMSMAAPEDRSRWLVRQAARDGEVVDVQVAIWRLTEEGLAEAAAAAGPPRILLVGPASMMQGDP
jgi:hypothetical protein